MEQPGNYTVFFDGAVAVGGILDAADAVSGYQVQVGAMPSDYINYYHTVAVIISSDGTVIDGVISEPTVNTAQFIQLHWLVIAPAFS